MVRFVPMTKNDYQCFLDTEIKGYAQDQIEAGVWAEDKALELSRKAFGELLPKGLSTPDQFLFMIERQADSEKLGYLWFGKRAEAGNRLSVLYDFLIFEQFRMQGYGSAALKALDEKLLEMGEKKVLLHVFGSNTAARALYRKMGYSERNITMVKELSV